MVSRKVLKVTIFLLASSLTLLPGAEAACKFLNKNNDMCQSSPICVRTFGMYNFPYCIRGQCCESVRTFVGGEIVSTVERLLTAGVNLDH